jgi:hypothetical protein
VSQFKSVQRSTLLRIPDPARNIYARNDAACLSIDKGTNASDQELTHFVAVNIPRPDIETITLKPKLGALVGRHAVSAGTSHRFPIVCPATKHCGVSGITEIRRFLTCGSRMPSQWARV